MCGEFLGIICGSDQCLGERRGVISKCHECRSSGIQEVVLWRF